MRMLLCGLLVLTWSGLASAADLGCDPHLTCTVYDVEVNGTVVATDLAAQSDGSLLWNVDHLSTGPYEFKARCAETAGGWKSDWSDPLNASKAGAPGNVRISP